MTNDTGGNEPGGEAEARPVLNDRPPEQESSDEEGLPPEALRSDTGNAIDVDAAHDRSS